MILLLLFSLGLWPTMTLASTSIFEEGISDLSAGRTIEATQKLEQSFGREDKNKKLQSAVLLGLLEGQHQAGFYADYVLENYPIIDINKDLQLKMKMLRISGDYFFKRGDFTKAKEKYQILYNESQDPEIKNYAGIMLGWNSVNQHKQDEALTLWRELPLTPQLMQDYGKIWPEAYLYEKKKAVAYPENEHFIKGVLRAWDYLPVGQLFKYRHQIRSLDFFPQLYQQAIKERLPLFDQPCNIIIWQPLSPLSISMGQDFIPYLESCFKVAIQFHNEKELATLYEQTPLDTDQIFQLAKLYQNLKDFPKACHKYWEGVAKSTQKKKNINIGIQGMKETCANYPQKAKETLELLSQNNLAESADYFS
ncbi:MAG: hypothetical protein WCG27_08830, partial [Pseudomonadota bacterium]